MYLEIKTFHLITVTLSITLYLFRFVRYYAYSEVKPQPYWLKYLPHINDSLLFLSGIALISITKFIPFTSSAPWLSYKLIAVIIYIACGFWAMDNNSTKSKRILFFMASIGWLLMIVTLAVTKQLPLMN